MDMRHIQIADSVGGWTDWGPVAGAEADQEVERLKKTLAGREVRHVGEEDVSNRVEATWSILLMVVCPYCKECFDMLDDGWPEDVQAGESGTPLTEDYEIECPDCGRELRADFAY